MPGHKAGVQGQSQYRIMPTVTRPWFVLAALRASCVAMVGCRVCVCGGGGGRGGWEGEGGGEVVVTVPDRSVYGNPFLANWQN